MNYLINNAVKTSLCCLIMIILACNDNASGSVDVNSEHSSLVRTTYSSGEIKTEGMMIRVDDTILAHGYVKQFRKDGSLSTNSNFRYGELIGSSYSYDENGDLTEYRFYDPVGRLIYRSRYDKEELLEEEGVDQITPLFLTAKTWQPGQEMEIYAVNIPYRSKSLSILSKNRKDTLKYEPEWKGDNFKFNLETYHDTIIAEVIYFESGKKYLTRSSVIGL